MVSQCPVPDTVRVPSKFKQGYHCRSCVVTAPWGSFWLAPLCTRLRSQFVKEQCMVSWPRPEQEQVQELEAVLCATVI